MLQTAINTGRDLELAAGLWVVNPILLNRSNQRIVLADGVHVQAKRGAYHPKFQCLFSARGVHHVTRPCRGRRGQLEALDVEGRLLEQLALHEGRVAVWSEGGWRRFGRGWWPTASSSVWVSNVGLFHCLLSSHLHCHFGD